MSKERTVRLGGKLHPVVRIYSSGVGTQYSVMMDNGQVLPLTDDYVKKNPTYYEWLEACAAAFDDALTFSKPSGENLSGRTDLE